MEPDVSITDGIVMESDQPLDATLPGPVVGMEFVGSESQPKSMRRRAIHGSVWMFFGYGGSQVIRFAANIILARLLFPRAFGLMALINVLMQGLQMFSDLGIGPAIIKHTHSDDPNFLNTAWTMQVVRGFVLWAAAFVLAAPAAWFYGTPMLQLMLPVAALTAVISGFNSTKLFIEGRELRLARVVTIEILSHVISIFVMILLARTWGSVWALVLGGLWGPLVNPVWALVLGGLLGPLIKAPLSHLALPGMRNRFCWDRESAHHLYHFGRWIFVSTLFTFLAMQTDRLLLGRLTTIDVLGIYSIALGLVSMGVGVFEQFSNRILMPAMAHFKRKSHHQFREVVSQSRKYILSVAMMAVANMILLAPALFWLFYDSRYQGAGQIARWLGFGLWFTLLQRTSQASLLALGHSKALALANATNFLITIIGAPIGFYFWRIEGFILGWTLGNLAAAIIVDMALTRDGIPLLRQDAVLTVGLILFVAIGLEIRQALHLHDVWTANAWIVKLLSSVLLTIVSAGILYWEYRRSPLAYSGTLNIEMDGAVNALPEDTTRILSNGAPSRVNGRPTNDVIYRD